MTLEWTACAIDDREAIFSYIEGDSPRAAVVFDKRIESHTDKLKDGAEIERIGRVAGTRELVINRTPYIAAYAIAGDTVRVLRVLHGAQEWPDEIDDGNR